MGLRGTTGAARAPKPGKTPIIAAPSNFQNQGLAGLLPYGAPGSIEQTQKIYNI